MKINTLIATLIALLAAALPGVSADEGGSVAVTGAPSIAIAEKNVAFAPVLEGTTVVHDYTVENIGTADLQIQRIKTGCGCTTADFTRTIPPGAKGHISIHVKTRGYGGKIFKRPMTLFTNDPKNPVVELFISGPVDNFADIAPPTAVFRGKPDEIAEMLVSVTPDAKYPFKVVDSRLDKSLEGKIEYQIEELENGMVLRVSNLVKDAGHYKGRIYLKTDHPARPEISVTVLGQIE